MNNLEQINKQIADLQEIANKLMAENRVAVTNEINSKILEYGITAADLGYKSTTKEHINKPISKAKKCRPNIDWLNIPGHGGVFNRNG